MGATIEPGVGGRLILTPHNFKVHQGGMTIANYGILRTPDAGDEVYSDSRNGVYGGDIFLMGGTVILGIFPLEAGDGARGQVGFTSIGRPGEGGSVEIIAHTIRSNSIIWAGDGGYAGGRWDWYPGHEEPICVGYQGGDGGDVHVTGWDITYLAAHGGDDFHIDMTDLPAGAITATQGITLAVGVSGTIDLSGSAAGALQAGEGVLVASDVVTHDIDLETIAGENVTTTGSTNLAFVFLDGAGETQVRAGETVSVGLDLMNAGHVTDTYTLAISDTLGWVSGLPPTATVPALGLDAPTFTVTVPLSPTVNQDQITITARSQSNPDVSAAHEMLAYVTLDGVTPVGGVTIGAPDSAPAWPGLRVALPVVMVGMAIVVGIAVRRRR